MSTVQFEVSGLDELERDLRAAPLRVQLGARRVVDSSAVRVKREWLENARLTAGAHGRHYPDAIDFDAGWVPGGYEAQIGPRTDMPQGGMGPGFEYGSVHQPPHLDGNRALDREVPVLDAGLADLLGGIL
jgi:hypothetical protein